MINFPISLQLNQMDCGPTCLYMVSKYYGRSFSLEKLRELIEIGREWVNMIIGSDSANLITSGDSIKLEICAVHGINSCLWINQLKDTGCNYCIINLKH